MCIYTCAYVTERDSHSTAPCQDHSSKLSGRLLASWRNYQPTTTSLRKYDMWVSNSKELSSCCQGSPHSTKQTTRAKALELTISLQYGPLMRLAR